MNPKETTFIEELVRVIRPSTSNHIWNEEKYERSEVLEKDGIKTVLLREKSEIK